MTVPSGLFEDEKDDRGNLVLSEHGVEMIEAVDAKIGSRIDNVVEAIDQYFADDVSSAIEESVEELRRLMILSVSEIAGPEAVANFIKRVAELARAGALSSASGEWASGGPSDASSNRDSIRGGGISVREEDVEPLTEGYVRAISRAVRKG
jgi:hypothetical protein